MTSQISMSGRGDHRHLVDKGDVDVAERVLQQLRGSAVAARRTRPRPSRRVAVERTATSVASDVGRRRPAGCCASRTPGFRDRSAPGSRPARSRSRPRPDASKTGGPAGRSCPDRSWIRGPRESPGCRWSATARQAASTLERSGAPSSGEFAHRIEAQLGLVDRFSRRGERQVPAVERRAEQRRVDARHGKFAKCERVHARRVDVDAGGAEPGLGGCGREGKTHVTWPTTATGVRRGRPGWKRRLIARTLCFR